MNELIHPEVRVELKRLGVDDLPWRPADGERAAVLQVWNETLRVGPRELTYDDGHPLIRLARARYNPPAEPPETPCTAFEKAERLLSHLKPSNVSDTRRELLGDKDEVGLLRLAVMEGMPDYRKSTREKHEAICAALVMLRETLARPGLTHADKDAVVFAAAEKLEEAL